MEARHIHIGVYTHTKSLKQQYILQTTMASHHILIAVFPAQGHINPALQFAQRLLNKGTIHVTLFTSVYAHRHCIAKIPDKKVVNSINFATFSDGYDEGLKPGDGGRHYMTEMKNRGLMALKNTLSTSNVEHGGRPVTLLVFTHLFAWAEGVARAFHVPTALLWIEPAAVFDIFYYYFNGYGDQIDAGSNEIRLPGLPLLSVADLPSFLLPSSPMRFRLIMKDLLDVLDVGQRKAKVLVNSFDALEADAIMAIEKYEMIGIGPLIPSAFVDGKDPSHIPLGVDACNKAEDNGCTEWLNTKPAVSVVYVSFGSMMRLPKAQMEAIAKGLLESKRPFLWVIREGEKDDQQTEKEGETPRCLEELGQVGKIVKWCSQMEVLSHPSLGCFVTHCGWNSTLESIALGVPMVAFPRTFDQGTNAKLIEDVWKIGVRVQSNVEDFVESGEITRCIEEVMDGGQRSQQLRESVRNWMNLAREAIGENGSSFKNLNCFLEELN